MGRPRWIMVSALDRHDGDQLLEYAFGSAEDTLHDAHLWSSGHIFWLMGVWMFFQAARRLPAGRLRESGTSARADAMMLGALGTVMGYLALA